MMLWGLIAFAAFTGVAIGAFPKPEHEYRQAFKGSLICAVGLLLFLIGCYVGGVQ